ncbi:MAG: hypothetical protein P4L41_10815 [Flavipsychrobacter sp.]|nr:hypothetical protein [Flavipsychrobacter sp.]
MNIDVINQQNHPSMSQCAICITMPDCKPIEIMNAAIKHDVHIVDKEYYDAEKDYDYFLAKYDLFSCGLDVSLLFIFSDEESVLISKDDQMENFLAEYNALRYAHLMLS